MKKVTDDQRKLEKLAKKDYSSEFFRELRRLEGVDFDSPFNFAWRMDFADVFSPKKGQAVATMSCQFAFVNEVTPQQSFVDYKEEPGGFDIIVGNPPFVTARNPVKRKLWRERWKFVCTKNYQLVSPFLGSPAILLKLPANAIYERFIAMAPSVTLSS